MVIIVNCDTPSIMKDSEFCNQRQGPMVVEWRGMMRWAAIMLALLLLSHRGVAQRKFSNIGFGEAHVVNCFAQDASGMIWIGTNHGLYSYDGYSTISHATHSHATSSQVNSMLIAGDTIYIGADCGLLAYDIAHDSFCDTVATAPSDIRALARHGGTLLIGSLGGFYELDIATRSIARRDRGLSNSTVYSILPIEGEGIYVGTYNGLNKYLPQSKEFRHIAMPTPNAKKNTFVNSLLYDSRRGCLWVGIEGSLYTMDLLSHRFTRIDGFGYNSIKSLAIDDASGEVMVGTDNGLYSYTDQGIVRYSHNSRISSSLLNNVVWSVFFDRDHNLWAGTDYNVSLSPQSDNNLISIYELTGSEEGNVIYAIARDSRGLLWLGGTNGLIRCEGSMAGTLWYSMDNALYPLTHNRIRAIYCGRNDELWIAGDGGLNRYDYATRRFRRYHIVSSDRRYNANWAYSIFEDSVGNVWVGSFLGGVLVVSRDKLLSADSEVIADHHITFGDAGNFVNQMIPATDGGAWVLLYRGGGLYKIDGRSFSAKRVNVEAEMGNTLSHIIATPDGRLWCASDDVIAIFDAATCECITTLRLNRYATNRVTAMALVAGKVWVATSSGVWAIDATSYCAERLDLPNHTFYSIAHDAAAGRVLLGGLDEIAEVSLGELQHEQRESDIFFTAMWVNDELRASAGILRSQGSIELRHDENHIAVCVSDFGYSPDCTTQFVYKIEEHGSKWLTLPLNTNRITLSNLPPGTYTVRVKAVGADGKLTANERTLVIRIAPPWYASTPALIVYALLLLALVMWIIHFYRVKNRLRIAGIEKEKTVEQIALKTEFFANISHDLKTPLSLIMGPIGRLIPQVTDPAVEKQLNLAYENALKMNTLIHTMLDTKRIDSDTETLMILSQVDMVNFGRNIVQTFAAAYEQKHFIFTCDVDTIYMDIDVVKMESVINNIISNACKYSGENATIAVAVERQEDNLVIKISDDGMGIAERDLPFIFQRLYQSPRTKGVKEGTGIGLYIAKKFVELHGGRIGVASVEGSGTTFTIVLPMKCANEALPGGQSESGKAAKNGTVLIVEDNEAIRNFLTDTLADDYKCLMAANGRAGLAVCGSVVPDLMIIDYMMPVMDGIEMCRRIKENPTLACVPIIMLTAKDDAAIELRSTDMGVDCFKPKPFNVQVLQSRVRQLIGNKDRMRSHLRMEEITAEVKEIEAESGDERLLADVVKLIEDHIDDTELNVNFLGDKLGVSSKQLYRKLKQHLGVTPVDFIRQVRMKKAAMLLQQNKFTISEIMYMVGFSSSSYFAKCFQAHFGVTPRQYAEEHRPQP